MEVCSGIHALEIPFLIRPKPGLSIKRLVYVYLLLGEQVTLIDAGVAGCERQIVEYLESCGRKPEEITTVLLTHAHPDHIGSVYTLKDSLGCDVWAHAGTRAWIEDVELQNQERPVPGFHELVAGSVTLDRVLADEESLDFAGLGEVQVLHTPGHCPGSTSFWLPEQQALFTGDALCMGAGFPVYEDVAACLASIQRLAEIENVQHLLSSWDKPRQSHEVGGVMQGAIHFLARVDDLVRLAMKQDGGGDDLWAMTGFVVKELGLPEIVVNALTVRSIASHLTHLDKSLFTGPSFHVV